MTLSDFEARLKKINPLLNVRIRAFGDIGGLFLGSEYLLRLTKGELNLNGYRIDLVNPEQQVREGQIMKRGRKTIVKMLRKHVPLNQSQIDSLLWGIDA